MRQTADGVFVGTVLGVPLLIQNSVVGTAPLFLIGATLANSTPDLVTNLAVLPLLILSIVAHELAHARVASAAGIPVRHIALTWFGGFAEFWLEPTSRWREAVIAFAGPATNLAIAGLGFAIIAVAFPFAPSPFESYGGVELHWRKAYHQPMLGEIILRVAWFNLAIGLFNLLPGMPLDGGHILRAALSGWLSRGRASWIAAWAGVVIGAAVVVTAFAFENVWALVIGAL